MNSQDQILSQFKIKVALDTNILSYLLDETFPKLNYFIESLSSNPFIEVVSSSFVIYELIGVRKLEHYLRAIHNTASSSGKVMNFSSALRYKNDWNSPELNYRDVFLDVKENVEKDLLKINDAFGITFQYEGLHSELWNPHQDLVLSSKVSKEDSLVLLSSAFPYRDKKEDHLIFLTNDDRFHRAYCGDEKIPKIDIIFSNNDISPPFVYKIGNLRCPISDRQIDLLKGSDSEEQINDFINQFTTEFLAIKYSNLFLGKTLKCEAKAEVAKNLFCFELAQKKELIEKFYITIISKDLSAIYNHREPLSDFWNYGSITSYPYIANSDSPDSRRISAKIQISKVSPIELKLIQSPGNLIFIHPDS